MKVLDEIIITAQKMRFSIKDFFSKCDHIRSSLVSRIWLHLLKKSLMENLIFRAVKLSNYRIVKNKFQYLVGKSQINSMRLSGPILMKNS